MKRLYLNSIVIIAKSQHIREEIEMGDNSYIIQCEQLCCDYCIVECIRPEMMAELIPLDSLSSKNSPVVADNSEDATAREYSAVVLNHDPLLRYSGCTLGSIFEKKDTEWIGKALSVMKNEYIRTRIDFLAKYHKKRGNI